MKKNDRLTQSWAPLFQNSIDDKCTNLVLTSSSDIGVIRNFGRNGARFAPTAILNVTKKLGNHLPENTKIAHLEVADEKKEEKDFLQGQAYSKTQIHSSLQKFKKKKILHIGGGHDHISPLLQAVDELGFDKIIVLNIDAHCDTRIDESPHSGTPFRDFAHQAKTPWHLYQYGIHKFANNNTTMSPLPQNNMSILFYEDIIASESINLNFIHESISSNTALILSLDVDALEASIFEGVSAVNHNGLSLNHIHAIINLFFEMGPNATKYMGIYEYNPIFDNLSQKGARGLAYLINSFWEN